MKRTLIIHPKDYSTNFLRGIYKDIQFKTIITGGCSQDDVIEEIKRNDRIIMCGHGTPDGLLSIGGFVGKNVHIINQKCVPHLKDKECIFIWCNADKFVERHKLNGFYSGMFVSEVGEARYCGVEDYNQSKVSSSNYSFSEIVSRHIHNNLKELYENVKVDYGILAENNPVVKYNHERLYFV